MRRDFISMYSPKPLSFLEESINLSIRFFELMGDLELDLIDGPNPQFNSYLEGIEIPEGY